MVACGLSGTTGAAGTSRTQRGGWKMVEDGLSNDKKRGKLTGDATSAERMAFGRMVRHTHTHNALQGQLRAPEEARRDVIHLVGARVPRARYPGRAALRRGRNQKRGRGTFAAPSFLV